MITSVKIRNFKNLRDQQIDLERLTVFVGANGSGKTSVLEALHLAVNAARPRKDAPNGRPGEVFGDERHCDWLYTRGGEGELSIACLTPAGEFIVRANPPLDFPPQQADMLGKGRWLFDVSSSDGTSVKDALQPASSMVFLHLNAKKLAKAAYSDRIPPCVEYDGEGLAAVLAYVALNDPDGFDELVQEMKDLIPHLRRIRFGKASVRRSEKEFVRFGDDTVERRSSRAYQGDSMIFDFHNANNVSAHSVSEGTLMLLGLLTVLLGPTRPDILLLDDMEHGLHPLAQKALLDVIAKVMQKYPHLQILASAHSPYLLDGLEPEQIRLTTAGDDGHSVCGRLTDHPEFDKWKDEMAPGELWSLFGEKWLTPQGDNA